MTDTTAAVTSVAMTRYTPIWVDYTNWRGERRQRWIRPIELFFGSNQWHPESQWLLRAEDCEEFKIKIFAMRGFHEWSV